MTSDIWTDYKGKIKKVDLVIGVRLSGKMFISVLTNWELGAEQFSCLSSRTFQTARGPSWLKAFSDFDWTEMCSNKQAFSLTRRVMFLQNNIPVKTPDDLMSTCFAVMSLHNAQPGIYFGSPSLSLIVQVLIVWSPGLTQFWAIAMHCDPASCNSQSERSIKLWWLTNWQGQSSKGD